MMFLFYHKNVLTAEFIPGVCLGIEVFSGPDAATEDLFAITFDLLIIRFTYIRKR